MNKEVDFYKLGRSVYNKLSKKKFDKIGKKVPMEQEIFINLKD